MQASTGRNAMNAASVEKSLALRETGDDMRLTVGQSLPVLPVLPATQADKLSLSTVGERSTHFLQGGLCKRVQMMTLMHILISG